MPLPIVPAPTTPTRSIVSTCKTITRWWSDGRSKCPRLASVSATPTACCWSPFDTAIPDESVRTRGSLMSQVRLAGTGMTSFGSHPDRTGRDMFASAGIDPPGPAFRLRTSTNSSAATSSAPSRNDRAPGPFRRRPSERPFRHAGSKARVPRANSRSTTPFERSGNDADVVVAGGMER